MLKKWQQLSIQKGFQYIHALFLSKKFLFILFFQKEPSSMSSKKQKQKILHQFSPFQGQISNSQGINSEYYQTICFSPNTIQKAKQVKEKVKMASKGKNYYENKILSRLPASKQKQRSFSNQREAFKNKLKQNPLKSKGMQKPEQKKFEVDRYKTEPTESTVLKSKVKKPHEQNGSGFQSKYKEILQKTRLCSAKIDNIIAREPKSSGKHPTSMVYTSRSKPYYISHILRNYKNQNSSLHIHIQNNIDYVKLFQNECDNQFYQKQVTLNKLNLEKKDKYLKRKTIIFDLDETLIHCNTNFQEPFDRKGSESMFGAFYINIRPYAKELLENLAKKFELMVFTASQQTYADQVLKILDPQAELIQHRLYRKNCIQYKGKFVKDLRIINRNLEEVVLVDNAGYSYEMQKENGIPIVPFFKDTEDVELRSLEQYLDSLTFVKDVREMNKRMFKLHRYGEFQTAEDLIEKLYATR